MTDAQLVQKFLNGDVNAFNTLVWRWEKNLYNFVLRYIGDKEEAKDICQKVFVRSYKKLNRLRDPEKFSTWLYQIAVNLCRDEYKRKNRRRMLSLEALNENRNGENPIARLEDDVAKNPDSITHAQDMKELLKLALQIIPEEQRAVIIMKEYQGLKFTEIADILETPVNTTKSRMYYGLSALRKIFKQWKISEEMIRYEM